MGRFSDILLVGGKANSLGRSDEVVQAVITDHAKLDELFSCISHDNAWVRMRAIDSFEKVCRVHPEWVAPYTDKMLQDLTDSTQPSVLWHLAEIFIQIELSPKQRSQVIVWLVDILSTTDVDWIVSANAMKAIIYFMNVGAISKDQARTLFEVQQQHHSKSVRKKATQLLESI